MAPALSYSSVRKRDVDLRKTVCRGHNIPPSQVLDNVTQPLLLPGSRINFPTLPLQSGMTVWFPFCWLWHQNCSAPPLALRSALVPGHAATAKMQPQSTHVRQPQPQPTAKTNHQLCKSSPAGYADDCNVWMAQLWRLHTLAIWRWPASCNFYWSVQHAVCWFDSHITVCLAPIAFKLHVMTTIIIWGTVME